MKTVLTTVILLLFSSSCFGQGMPPGLNDGPAYSATQDHFECFYVDEVIAYSGSSNVTINNFPTVDRVHVKNVFTLYRLVPLPEGVAGPQQIQEVPGSRRSREENPGISI